MIQIATPEPRDMKPITNKYQSSNGGIGFAGALFLLFLGLKLGKVIDWSWWWITAPLWGPAAIVLSIWLGVIMFGIMAIGFLAVTKKN